MSNGYSYCCPRCFGRSWERLGNHFVCYDCGYSDRASDGRRGEDETTCLVVSKPSPPIFSKSDYSIVNRGIKYLSKLQQTIIEMRFWFSYSVSDIADMLRIREEIVDESLSEAFRLLKGHCLSDPNFSRSRPVLKAA